MGQILDPSTVRHVAQLARLNLSDDELTHYAEQLSRILKYIDQLNELDTSDVPPTAHAMPVQNVFREDQIAAAWTAERALHNAPAREDNLFKVPKVLDQESA